MNASRFVTAVIISMGLAAGAQGSPASAATLAGSPWRVVPSPRSTGVFADLSSVSADSATDAWAVGSTGGGDPMVVHWNGVRWRIVPLDSSVPEDLSGVVAISPRDVWVVGLSNDLNDFPLADHWNGSGWKVFHVPKADGGEPLSDVAATGPSDVWATDEFSNIYHFNGTSWSVVYRSGARKFAMSATTAIAAVTPTDVWVAGQRVNQAGTVYEATAVHWNGAIGTVHTLPQTRSAAPAGIAAAGPHDVWIAGSVITDTGVEAAYATRWNGHRWVNHPTPSHPEFHTLNDVAVLPDGDVWAVGARIGKPASAPEDVLEDEWTGHSWTEWGGPNPSAGNNDLFGESAIPGTGRLWAVGRYAAGGDSNFRTLIMRCCG